MKNKGASLIWALMVGSVLFVIAVTASDFVVKESKMSIRMDDSAIAIAAAESGIEWGKYCISELLTCADGTYPPSGAYELGDSTYKVTISDTKTRIISSGKSGNVNRSMEYEIVPNQPLDVSKVANTFTLDGSYVQEFDYWTNGINRGRIGVQSTDLNTKIYFEHYLDGASQKIRVSAQKGASTVSSTGAVLVGSLNPTISSVYSIRVRIEYTKDLSVKMTVSQHSFDPNDPVLVCVNPLITLDLKNIGISSSDLTSGEFYFFPSTAVLRTGVSGELQGETYYEVGTSSVFFDNMRSKGLTQL